MNHRKTTPRTQVAITREGWYYLGMLSFIVAGAIIRDINLLYIMAGMMLGPMLFSWYASTKSLRRIDVRRRHPKLVSVGDAFYVESVASKPKNAARCFATLVTDRVIRHGDQLRGAMEAEMFFPAINAGSSAEASYRVSLSRRGRYQLGPMKVSTSVPLGLVRVTKTFHTDAEVLVSPKVGSLSSAWTRHLDFKNDGGQKSARRRGNAEGDFYGMRDWRNGDGRNRIHWRTSAKRSKLTVRQFEQRVNQDLVVILDLYNPANKPPTSTPVHGDSNDRGTKDRGSQRDYLSTMNREEIESAVSFAATLVVQHCRQGAAHVVVASASRARFKLHGLASPVFRAELMERLAVVEPSQDDLLPSTLSEVLPLAAPSAKIVLVSTRDRDLNDTQAFESVWKNTRIRRSLSDIVKVNTATAEFADWFQSEQKQFQLDDSANALDAAGETPIDSQDSQVS